MLMPHDVARFWAKVDRDGPIPSHCPELGPCWIWTGSRRPVHVGYGKMRLHGAVVSATHVAWEIAFGTPCEYLLHRCDNPPCVRPSHLFVGTKADNAHDRDAKGRTVNLRGAEHGRAKLTTADVLAIRARYAAGDTHLTIMSIEYDVTVSLIWRVVHNLVWKHLGIDAPADPPRPARQAPIEPPGIARGERTGTAKLTDAKVREMRARRANGARLTELAADYGCSTATVSLIANGKIWKHVSALPLPEASH